MRRGPGSRCFLPEMHIPGRHGRQASDFFPQVEIDSDAGIRTELIKETVPARTFASEKRGLRRESEVNGSVRLELEVFRCLQFLCVQDVLFPTASKFVPDQIVPRYDQDRDFPINETLNSVLPRLLKGNPINAL